MTASGKKSSGILYVIGFLLLSSAAIRLGLGIGEARALIPAQERQPLDQALSSCPSPPGLLVEALQNRAERIATEERRIAERAALLDQTETRVKTLLEDLRNARNELDATLTLADGAAESDLARLTAVYEAMKPKDAAILFEQMDPDFSAGFLARMRPEIAAEVLAGMSANTAYTVSLLIAGRNASVPRD